METLLELVLDLYGPAPYILIFSVLLACGLGLPIPEDVTLFVAGVLAYYGVCNLKAIILLSLAGVVVGDSFMWWLGNRYGRKLASTRFFSRILTPQRLDQVATRLNAAKGERLLFAARFMPGLRAPIFFTSGTLHVPYWKFVAYDGSAALLSVPAIIYAIYAFGDALDQVITVIKRVEHGILGVIALGIAVIVGKWFWKKRKGAESRA